MYIFKLIQIVSVPMFVWAHVSFDSMTDLKIFLQIKKKKKKICQIFSKMFSKILYFLIKKKLIFFLLPTLILMLSPG